MRGIVRALMADYSVKEILEAMAGCCSEFSEQALEEWGDRPYADTCNKVGAELMAVASKCPI